MSRFHTQMGGRPPVNLSVLQHNRAKAVRFSTLDAICRELDCQPADILAYVSDEPPSS